MGQVYKITNTITNQSYIGITKHTFRIRYNSRDDWWNKTHNIYLKNSVLCYGIDNFSVTILKETDMENLEELEIAYIKQYNTVYPNGFNMTSGGNYRYTHSDVSILKMRESLKILYETKDAWNKGKTLSKEHIDKVSKTKKLKYESGEITPWNKDKKTGRPSESSIRNSALAHKKKIFQCDLLGNIIREFNGLIDTKEYGFNPSVVCLCCKGKAKTHKGFTFRYV